MIGSSWFWRMLAIIVVVTPLVIWACYGFRSGRLADLPIWIPPAGRIPTTGWPGAIRNWRIPGHEFVHGLLFLRQHTITGHGNVFMGRFSQRGFWLFYPAVLLVKAPIPFLLFAMWGLIHLCRRSAGTADGSRAGAVDSERWWFAGLSLAAFFVLVAAMTSPINLGVRHVLVIYPLVAVPSAYGTVRSARASGHPWFRLAGGVGLVAAQLGVLAASTPNQIAYFNPLAGRDPGYISSDSDFDWGQDMLALERYFASHPVPELYLLQNGTTRACVHHLPRLKALPPDPVSGWIAAFDRPFRLNRGFATTDPCTLFGPGTIRVEPGWLDWLKRYQPVATVGTVHLYYVPPADALPDPDALTR